MLGVYNLRNRNEWTTANSSLLNDGNWTNNRNNSSTMNHDNSNSTMINTSQNKSAVLLGEVKLRCFYNDGGTATGDNIEMKLAERMRIAEGGKCYNSCSKIRRSIVSSSSILFLFSLDAKFMNLFVIIYG